MTHDTQVAPSSAEQQANDSQHAVITRGDFQVSVLLGIIASLVSLKFFPLYTEGDQRFYTHAFELSVGGSFDEVRAFHRLWTGSSEPIYPILVYLFQFIGGKTAFSSIVNAFLVASTFLVCRKYRTPRPILALGACSLYFLVLLFPAERLGLAFTFLALGALTTGRKRHLFVMLAILSHFSILILTAFAYSDKLASIIHRTSKMTTRKIANTFASISVALLLTSPLWASLGAKIAVNAQFSPKSKDLVIISSLTAACLVLSPEKLRVAISLTPMIFGVALVGGFRINMLAFVVALYFLQHHRLARQFLLYPALMWTLYRGFGFIENVLRYGTGFPNYLLN